MESVPEQVMVIPMDLNKLQRGLLSPFPGSKTSSAEAFLDQLGIDHYGVAWNGEIKAHCPFHEDRNPSFSFNENSGMWICFAGCGSGNWVTLAREILEPVAASRIISETEGTFAGGPHTGADEPVFWAPAHEDYVASPSPEYAEYDYQTSNGELSFQIVRRSTKAGKTFSARRPAAGGGWSYNLPHEYRIPYNLPGVLRAIEEEQTIYLVEGEKDADAISGAGGVATTAPFGGTAKWRQEFNTYFKGADVIIVADRETPGPGKPAPGLRHALDARDSLAEVVTSVQIVGAREGKDAADHLFHGYGLDEFELFEDPFVAPSPREGTQQTFVWHTGPDVPSVTKVEWIAYPFVARGTHVHVIGDPKVGKTTYLLALADAVASGTDFLGEPTIQMPVVYLSEQTQTVFWQQLTPGLRQKPRPPLRHLLRHSACSIRPSHTGSHRSSRSTRRRAPTGSSVRRRVRTGGTPRRTSFST
jgi:AAA domain/CHC2 zinc finger